MIVNGIKLQFKTMKYGILYGVPEREIKALDAPYDTVEEAKENYKETNRIEYHDGMLSGAYVVKVEEVDIEDVKQGKKDPIEFNDMWSKERLFDLQQKVEQIVNPKHNVSPDNLLHQHGTDDFL